MTLSVCEIFRSLQGEASTAGLPTVFVRLAGCNLRCRYCDTAYAWEGGEVLDIGTVLAKIRDLGEPKRICLTGGEPLAQREGTVLLAEALLAAGYEVSMETNGSYPVEGLPAGLVAVIDIKTPGSGMSGVMNLENMRLARRHHDIFKFVIAAETDIAWALDLVRKNRLASRYRVLFSPAAGDVTPARLAGAILESGLDIGLNLQLHKYIWPGDPRGR